MKKWLGWLLCLVCLLMLCASAMADADPTVVALFETAQSQASDVEGRDTFKVFEPIESKYNPTPGLVDGIVATTEYRDNRLYVHIDVEATDWNTVIARGYTAGSGHVNIRPGFDTPADYQGHMSFGCWLDEKENYIIELLKRDYQSAGSLHVENRADNGDSIGRYDEETRIFQPDEMEDGNFVCVWLTEDGKLEFRYLQTTVTFSSTDAFKVELPGVPAENIHLQYVNMTQAEKERVDVKTARGSVMMEATDISGMSDMWVNVCALIPEELENSTVTCKFVSWDGNEYDYPVESPIPGEPDAPSRPYVNLTSLSFSSDNSVREDEFTLIWYQDGELWGYQTLYASLSTGTPKPWPNYVQGWKPVPAERLNGLKSFFLSGLDVEYDESIGLLTYTVEPDELPLSADYSKVNYTVFVEPPALEEGDTVPYAYRGTNQSGGNIVLGLNASGHWQDQLQRTRDHAKAYVDESIYGLNLFSTYHQQGSDLTVYMTTEMTGPYAGGVVLISWWKEGQNPETDDPAYVEFFSMRQEKCVRVLESTPYEDENALPSVIRQPVIVLENGSINHPEDGLKFVAEIYPQQSENCMYYRLKLVDENGDEVKLDEGQYKVFLPYPEGLTDEEKASLTISHMNDAHVEVENFSINGNTLHLTDAGLWFQAKSFSPFLLEWEGESSGECTHENLYCDATMNGIGMDQFCEGCSHEAYVELIGRNWVYNGEPYEPILNFAIGEWIRPESLVVLYAQNIDGDVSDWFPEAPVEKGEYLMRLTCEDHTTDAIAFSIMESCSHERLSYEVSEDGMALIERCAECQHEAMVTLDVPGKTYDGEPVQAGLIFNYGDWQNPDALKIMYVQVVNDEFGEWTDEAPSAVGDYVACLGIGEEVETDGLSFSITESTAEDSRISNDLFDDSYITAQLHAVGMDSTAKIEIAMKAALLDRGVSFAGSELRDVQLQFLLNDQWVTANEQQFPTRADGTPNLQVQLPVPEAADPEKHDFYAVHMFATEAFGRVPGTMEFPDVAVKQDGDNWYLEMELTGFSPVLITWQPKAEEEIAPPPQTGDNAMPLVWIILCSASLLCAAIILRKKYV